MTGTSGGKNESRHKGYLFIMCQEEGYAVALLVSHAVLLRTHAVRSTLTDIGSYVLT